MEYVKILMSYRLHSVRRPSKITAAYLFPRHTGSLRPRITLPRDLSINGGERSGATCIYRGNMNVRV